MRFGATICCSSVALLLSGCAATEAKRTAQSAVAGVKSAVDEFKNCRSLILHKPEYSDVSLHLSSAETSQVTMEQLADKSIPTLEEAKSLALLYDDTSVCRSDMRSAISSYMPDLLPLFTESDNLNTNITLSLVQRKMTWGQAAQAREAARAEFQQKLSLANEQYLTELRAENQEELAQRRAAAALMLGYMQNQQIAAQQQAANQQQLYNQQLLLNSLNRPVSTSCFASGSMINCTSQ
jgi:hypothetical protein